MGQEIDHTRFNKKDFSLFRERLEQETALLQEWFTDHIWEDGGTIGGFELEAWLVDSDGHPAPINEDFLRTLDDPLVVPELARFNVEINTRPRALTGNALAEMERELATTWAHCRRVAAERDTRLAMVGILPSVRDSDLTTDNMSGLKRYAALNEQVLRLRGGRPLVVEIQGREHLRWAQWDVMLESAATSFQIHLETPPDRAVAFFNACVALSGPMVAACANSPFLFGKDLWDETRIPLFEQSVAAFEPGSETPRRVTFGDGYVQHSLFECFKENLDRYPLLLPMVTDTPAEQMEHLRLHNGAIWRWNRPLIGFRGDRPHLRIEHRVVPAGPTVSDSIANAALLFGLAHYLVDAEPDLINRLPFAKARDNFYQCARLGLEARIDWPGCPAVNVRGLLLERLLPGAADALKALGLDPEQVDHYLGIIRARVRSGRTGAAWQRAFVTRHRADMNALCQAYLERGESGEPVHNWLV